MTLNYEPGFPTPSFSHDDNGNVSSHSHVDRKNLDGVVQCQLVVCTNSYYLNLEALVF